MRRMDGDRRRRKKNPVAEMTLQQTETVLNLLDGARDAHSEKLVEIAGGNRLESHAFK